MVRTTIVLIALGFLVSVALPEDSRAQIHRSTLHDYRVVPVSDGLQNPWSIAFLPGGDILVTERPGRLRVIREGMLLPDAIPGVPEVFARGQGGLMDVQPHPDFASNGLIYITYSKPYTDLEGARTVLIRGTFQNDALTNVEELFSAQAVGGGHYGSRIAFDGNGYVFITAGDRQVPSRGDLYAHPAQDLSNHHGVVVRLHDDGRIPADNPFVGTEGALGEIWSYGHRNPQGLAFHPMTGELWANEHGPQGGDELNVVLPGRNYGWPVIGYGVNYGSGSTIHEGTLKEGMESPKHFWVPSIATSGLMIYTGDKFPAWRGNIFVGGLGGEQLSRLTIDGHTILNEETLFQRMGRIRDVRQGPDGYIYLAIEDRRGAPTGVVRIEPAGAR
ncbi:MAG TPA: PQQ-dependent sugar dehydrogenase [Gemmatimonadetes bacterium]|jgi:glucose/arabinose dehydrogenase|nr:PQQ-dependent sugar dehydrogenase [Gemmatimonadota bacterium]HIB08794.1 PQQ-dependent sugar dehydrogenase [Gemmatimonadota bacterium]HIN78694.1 PQQ-dependent sugar dehydrogenase [Gemmatimonadota bacterium]